MAASDVGLETITEPIMIARDSDPHHWKLLIFYYNPADPRLFVPKRTGLPVTLNFARPAAWLLMGVILAGLVIAAVMNN